MKDNNENKKSSVFTLVLELLFSFGCSSLSFELAGNSTFGDSIYIGSTLSEIGKLSSHPLYLIGGSGIIGAAGTYATSLNNTEIPVGKVNGHQVYKNGFGDLNTEDANPYEVVSRRANKIYDVLHKEHDREEKSALIVESPKDYETLIKILNSMDKKELNYLLSALIEMLEEQQLEDKGFTKKLKN